VKQNLKIVVEYCAAAACAFSDLSLLVGQQEGHTACKN